MGVKKYFVCISGNIGAGKSTVANILESVFGFKKHEEVVENNPYLPLFYEDMKKWGYKLQRYFLMTRFVSHENISMLPHSAVQDRSIYEDMEVFAKLHIKNGNFTPEQARRYTEFCKMVYEEIKAPDLIIYLKAPVSVLKDRIKKRGREYEMDLIRLDNPYLDELQKLYDDWISRYNFGPKLVIETDKLNFVDNPDDIKTLINKIKTALMRKEKKLHKFV